MIDEPKLLNVLLYVLGRLNHAEREFHKIFKILWFADIAHIKEYGRLITDDEYMKMEYGPVPSFLYDLLKGIRNHNPVFDKYRQDISVSGYKVDPLKAADMDYLSPSDVNVLDESIEENRHLSMGVLTDKSHGQAWKKSADNQRIYMESILDEIGMSGQDRELVLESYAFSRHFSR